MNNTNGNITNHFYESASANPGKYALLHPEKVTFSELRLRIDSYAAGFTEKGIRKATRTIVLVSPGIDLFAVTFALLRIGAIPVMIDPGMGNRAMARALSEIGAEAFVGIPKAHLLRMLFPGIFKTVRIFFSTRNGGIINTSGLRRLCSQHHNSCEPCPVQSDETAAIFFTSGSTGPAKAVVYESGMFDAQIRYMKDHFQYRAEDVDLCTFPLIGLLVICHGISIVMADMDMTHPKTMKPAKLFNNIERYACSTMFCSPMVLRKLADYGLKNHCRLSSLKKVFTAGAPVSPVLLKDFRKLLDEDAVIHTPFGSTEGLSVTDIQDRELLAVYPDMSSYLGGICVGKPLKDIELKIIRITDDPISHLRDTVQLGIDEIGEIIVTGPNVTRQYYRNDEANRKAKTEDDIPGRIWHRTGDLGRLDGEGRLWYCGRKSQRVLSGGRTYFTIPCESVYNRHPAVLRSALVGIKKDDGYRPVICVQLKKGMAISKQLKQDLLMLGKGQEITRDISDLFFHRKFPVDPRHNAKINREKLSVMAQKRVT
jgi:acyl-coenzyme A synthetase/AMP-(fatty) acid ligase